MKWIQRRVDHVVVILPFEPDLYRRAGVRCTFVGHPLLDEVAPQYDSTTNTAHAGAQVLFEILSLMVFSPFVTRRKD